MPQMLVNKIVVLGCLGLPLRLTMSTNERDNNSGPTVSTNPQLVVVMHLKEQRCTNKRKEEE